MRGVIAVAEQRAAGNLCELGLGIDVDASDSGQIDNQALVDGSQTAAVVAAAAHGQVEPVVAGETDRRDDVGDVGTARDDARPLVDHRVVDLASFLIAGVRRYRDGPSETRRERRYGPLVELRCGHCAHRRLPAVD